MFVLGSTWRDGYLDYHLPPDQVRVAVKAWWPLENIRDIYLPQPKSLARLWNYSREIGVRAVIRKIVSRRAEFLRNRRVVAVGVGEVVEAGDRAGWGIGASILFVAPCHPECAERVVLAADFVESAPPELLARLATAEGIRLFGDHPPSDSFDWDSVAGWSPFSGSPPPAALAAGMRWARSELARLDPSTGRVLPLGQGSVVQERSPGPGALAGELSAVVFGLGQYAKTNILPTLPRGIRLLCVHEVDPTQIGRFRKYRFSCDTSDSPRSDEGYDVFFIAGYHHTHADLAVHALESGAWAVVEKPLITTREQLDRLLAAAREHPGRLFAGFHMRYNPLWALARKDLSLKAGQPVHYNCIVFEVPLVRRHWYNWINSCSRIVSNACHWVDHFLFMNDYSEPVRWDLWRGSNGDAHISAELANGAVFSMSLTDMGSARIGMQDHVELRANGVTVKVDNGGRYFAEDPRRIIRRKKINKISVYATMYRTICRRILDGRSGDSIESIERGTTLMLDLEELLQRQIHLEPTTP